MDAAAISPDVLLGTLRSEAGGTTPLLIDVRRQTAFRSASTLIAGALRRDPDRVAEWAPGLPGRVPIVVYCVHGHEVSQGVGRALRERGIPTSYLEAGIEGWQEAGGDLQPKPAGGATAWITRERPKIDRIACPWLVRRFIDRDAAFHYVPAAEVMQAAVTRAAVPFDVKDAALGHHGSQCSFDAFIAAFRLRDDALLRLAGIVRAADTGQPDAAPEAAGLLAVSQGLSLNHGDDHVMLEHGMVIYDALYATCGGVRAWTV